MRRWRPSPATPRPPEPRPRSGSRRRNPRVGSPGSGRMARYGGIGNGGIRRAVGTAPADGASDAKRRPGIGLLLRSPGRRVVPDRQSPLRRASRRGVRVRECGRGRALPRPGRGGWGALRAWRRSGGGEHADLDRRRVARRVPEIVLRLLRQPAFRAKVGTRGPGRQGRCLCADCGWRLVSGSGEGDCYRGQSRIAIHARTARSTRCRPRKANGIHRSMSVTER